MKYFRGSIIFSVICLVAAFFLGFVQDGWVVWWSTLFIVFVLWILEISLSFDNAVVNVSTLKTMSPLWRKRFLTWGILIAVVGMRIVFPVLIVAIFGNISPWEAISLVVNDHARYGEILTSSHIAIAWFGGAFLMMVGLAFFLNKEKEHHWFRRIERWLTKLGKMEAVEWACVLIFLELFSYLLPEAASHQFFISGVRWVITYIIVNGLSSLVGASWENTTMAVAKSGLMSFLYLELLDASFSLDGVIGAFALSQNIFVIALGLGIGAYFVRSITIYLYEKWTIAQYRYLEHGAFYAIIALALMMFIGTIYHIPEVITGLIGAVLIGFSLWSSVRAEKKSH